MAREDPQLKLRLPADLKQRISDAAAANSRSLNSEIVQALEDKYPAPPDLDSVLDQLNFAITMMGNLDQSSAHAWAGLRQSLEDLERFIDDNPDAIKASLKGPNKRVVYLKDD